MALSFYQTNNMKKNRIFTIGTLFTLFLGVSTTLDAQSDNVDMNINMNVNERTDGLNMNINVGGTGMTGTQTTTTTTTVTTTSSSSTNGVVNSNTNTNTNTTGTGVASNPVATEEKVVSQPAVVENVCYPISSADLNSAKSSINAKPFADTKMTVAKQVIDNNCFNSSQVLELMALFAYEDQKIEVAKACYSKCVDQKNYYKVNDGFVHSSSIDELQEYIQSTK